MSAAPANTAAAAALATLSRRVELLLAGGLLLVMGLVVHDWSSQPASRYLLTVAAIDDHSLQLDRYSDYLGIDQARSGGHIYSDKAPYQPMLAAPAYQVYRWVGGDPFPAGYASGRFDEATSYGLWWVTLWSSTIPAAAVAIVVRRHVARTQPGVATPVAAAIVLGTTIQPFGGWLFGHVLAALFVIGAWAMLRNNPGSAPPRRNACLAGALLGLGIGTDYTVAAIAVVITASVLIDMMWRSAIALTVGAAVAMVPMLSYNWLAFGDPFETSYQGHLKSFEGQGALGVYNLQLPRADEITKALVGSRGLLVLTPLVLVALIGAGVAIAERGRARRDAVVALCSLVALVAVSTGIDGLGGDSPGPRYLIPALPLLALPLATAWRRAPAVCAIAALFGGGWMWAASVTTPAVDTSHPRPLRVWTQQLADGDLATNVLTGDSHSWILVAASAVGLVAIGAALRSDPGRGQRPSEAA
ncbi:MAG: hypothetical protein ACOYXM_00645 [Actinomycetota bacterium]